jgi:hypothetical protein
MHLASLHLPRAKSGEFFISSSGISRAEGKSIRDAVNSLALNGRLDKLETISLNFCSYIKGAAIAAILSKCYRSAKSIEIRYGGFTESAAAHIKRCTKLEAFCPRGNESAAEMVEIVQSCEKLRKVDLGGSATALLTR